jgi:hypothetical protein
MKHWIKSSFGGDKLRTMVGQIKFKKKSNKNINNKDFNFWVVHIFNVLVNSEESE